MALLTANNLRLQYEGLSVRFSEAAITQKVIARNKQFFGGGHTIQAAWTRKKELQTAVGVRCERATARRRRIWRCAADGAHAPALRRVFAGGRHERVRFGCIVRMNAVSFNRRRWRNAHGERQNLFRLRNCRSLRTDADPAV